MKQTLCGLVLLLGASVVAQRPGHPPWNSTLPTFPEGRQTPGQMPPDQNAPPERLSNHEAAQQIQQGLKSERGLSNSNIAVHVDKKSVILNGTIESDEQRELALRIAHSYSGDRQIVDKLRLRQQT